MREDAMFAESMLETSWAERGRRGWTTLTSFGLQFVTIGLLLLMPLLTTVGLPSARSVSTPVSFGHTDPGPTPRVRVGERIGTTPIVPYSGPILQPGSIPHGISRSGAGNTDPSPVGAPVVGLYIGHEPGFQIPNGGTREFMPASPSSAIKREFRTSK